MKQFAFDEIYEIWSKSKPNERIWSNELATKLGYPSSESLRSAFKRARKCMKPTLEKAEKIFKEIDQQGKLDFSESTEIHADGSITSEKIISIEKEDLKNPERLLELHGYDVQRWTLLFAKNNYWTMQSKTSEDGRITLYQSKITAKPKTIPDWTPELVDKLFNNLNKKDLSPSYSFPDSYLKNNKILVVPIADLHLGLIATQSSTGNEYNMEIAEDSYLSALFQIKERVAGQSFEKIFFMVGNDFLNSDTLTNQTTAGTPQDSVTFWFDMFDKALELIISGINILSSISKVEVINVVSNHDNQSMYAIMKAIDYYYKNNKNVTVDTSQLYRKYICYKKVLMGFSHDIDIKSALSIMTTEAKQDWGKCNKYYWFLAHLHKQMIYSNQGDLEILRIPTVSGWSRWSASKGYIQSDKKTQAFVIDGERGILDTLNIFV